MEERCTVVEIYPDTMEPKRKLFTGNHEECVGTIKFLMNRKGWPLTRLSILYSDGRHASFAIPRS